MIDFVGGWGGCEEFGWCCVFEMGVVLVVFCVFCDYVVVVWGCDCFVEVLCDGVEDC